MTKRYGRNQRRKHKEAIALLSEAVSRREYELQIAHNKLHKVDEWNDDIIKLLGQYTAFSKDIEIMKCSYFPELLPIDARLNASIKYTVDIQSTMIMPAPVRLIHFIEKLEDEDVLTMRRIVSLKMSNGKQLAYAINYDHLEKMQDDRKFINYLAYQIATQFARMIK